MKLIPPLSDKTKSDLKESEDSLQSLIQQLDAGMKRLISHKDLELKLTKRIAALDGDADAGNEDASVKLVAVRDQLARLHRTIRLEESRIAEALPDLTLAINSARDEIRAAHSGLSRELVTHVADFLAPYCNHRNEAISAAEQTSAFGALLIFTSPSYRRSNPKKFDTVTDAVAAAQSLLETLGSLLEGKPVIVLPAKGEAGGLTFPAHCG